MTATTTTSAIQETKQPRKDQQGSFYAVVRVRGSIGVRAKAEDTLKQLHLTRKNHCVLLSKTEQHSRMLNIVADLVTWGEASAETIEALKKRSKGDVVCRLNSPLKGFKGGIKTAFPHGALGYRKEKINDLIKSMLH